MGRSYAGLVFLVVFFESFIMHNPLLSHSLPHGALRLEKSRRSRVRSLRSNGLDVVWRRGLCPITDLSLLALDRLSSNFIFLCVFGQGLISDVLSATISLV